MAEKIWLANKKWKNNSIVSGAKTGMYVIWFFAIFWNLISWPMLLAEPHLYNSIKAKPETALVLLFPAIGIILIIVAINTLNNWRKFGTTPLVLDPFPGSLSGHVGGRVETNLDYDDRLDFSVTLACIHSYMSGSGKNRSRRESIIWQTEGVCFTSRSVKGTDLSFRFDVPENLPESDVEKASSYHLWRVSISCELPGTDFDRSFEIPVFNGIRKSENIDSGTEGYHRTITSANEGIEQIAQISTFSGGLEIYYPPFKRPGSGIMALILGAIFAGAGVGMGIYTDAPILFPIVFTPVGGLIMLFGIWDLAKSLRVRVDRDYVKARRYLFNYPVTTKEVPSNSIKSLTVKKGGSMSTGNKTTVFYSLVAHTNDSSKIVIAERLNSKPEAQLLEKNLRQYLPSCE